MPLRERILVQVACTKARPQHACSADHANNTGLIPFCVDLDGSPHRGSYEVSKHNIAVVVLPSVH